MSGIRRATITAPDAKDFARQALRTLGIVDRSNGYWAHELQAIVTGFCPDWVASIGVMKMLEKVRFRALRKKQK